MSAKTKVFLEQIVPKVRAMWSADGVPPAVNAVRTALDGGDATRLEFGISLVAAERGINCALLDTQPAEIRALVSDPRSPDGRIPLDPLLWGLLPEGVLSSALLGLEAVAKGVIALQAELERRVGAERDRADAVAAACDTRIAVALAATLAAELRYNGQDAEHERDTRDLRNELAAAKAEIARLSSGPSNELMTLTTVVSETGDAVRGVEVRLDRVEKQLRGAGPATLAAATPKAARSQPRPSALGHPKAARKHPKQAKSA